MARVTDPLRKQVRSEAQLRYGQSLADLLGARRTAHRQYKSDVSTAEDTARAIKLASIQAGLDLATIYRGADRTRTDAAHQIELATGAPAGSDSALAMALRGEGALAGERAAGEQARAQSETVSRGLDAVAGEAYAKRNLLQGYRGTRADLMSQTRGLHAQEGAFEQSRLGELQTAQAKAESDATKQARDDSWKRGIDPDTGQPTLDARKKIADLTGKDPVTGKPIPGKGPGGRTQAEQRQVAKDTADARDEISLARTWIQRMRAGQNPLPYQQIASKLKTGGSIPHTEEYTGRDSKGNPVKKIRQTEITFPAIKGDLLRAAVELEGRGYLSETSIHNLRTVRNVHVPKEWMPVKVKFHYRRPKSTGGGYADVNLPAGSR